MNNILDKKQIKKDLLKQRRQNILTLRNIDSKYWTYRRLGLQFGVKGERIRQIIRGEEERMRQQNY